MTTIRDMQKWHELEQEKNLSSMKTIAFAQAAHEFRNPLNGIIQSLELLQDMIDQERGLQYYQIAKNCSKLMLHLINDVLDFSQIEANKFVLNYDVVSIKDLLDESISVLKFKAESKGLEIFYEIEQNFPEFIITDENRVR